MQPKNLVCARANDMEDFALNFKLHGHVLETCTRCQHKVWVGKAGQTEIAKGGITVLCLHCALPELSHKDAEILPAEGALEEALKIEQENDDVNRMD